jgi:hypothetical protein
MLIHWQSGTRGTYMYAGAALYTDCRIHSMLGRHALKKHTQPLWFSSNFPISNFQYLFYLCFYFRPSVHPTIRPSVLTGLGIFFQRAPQIGVLAVKYT